MCMARGGVGGEWIGFYQSCGNRGVLDVYLCFGCGGMGGVCGEWFGPGSGGVGLCLCESGFSV